MDDVERRLVRCFAALFPDLDEAAIQHASMNSVAAWDSVATVTHVNLVEEDFRMQINLEDVEELVSFPQFLNYLRGRAVARDE